MTLPLGMVVLFEAAEASCLLWVDWIPLNVCYAPQSETGPGHRDPGWKCTPYMAQLWTGFNSNYQYYYVFLCTHLFIHPFFHMIKETAFMECLLCVISLARQIIWSLPHSYKAGLIGPFLELRNLKLGEVKRTADVIKLYQSQDSKPCLFHS